MSTTCSEFEKEIHHQCSEPENETNWSSSEEEEDEKTLKIYSYDGKRYGTSVREKFVTDILWAEESAAIRNLLRNNFSMFNFNIKTEILEQVLDFCKTRAVINILYVDDENLAQQKLKDIDSNFVKKDLRVLIDYLHAAYTLKIKSLFKLTKTIVETLLDGKEDSEISKIFILKEGFTLKEMDEVSTTFPWAFE